MSNEAPTIGWNGATLLRHRPGRGHSYSLLSPEAVLSYARIGWMNRWAGHGENGSLDRKVVVPVSPAHFRCATVKITEQMRAAWISPISAKVMRRSEGEDLFVGNQISRFWAWVQRIKIEPEQAEFAQVVCYSADALLENGGERSTDKEWEIVAVIASPVKHEPMTPLTMARNELEKVGGTKGSYTSAQYAESIYYWSQRARLV